MIPAALRRARAPQERTLALFIALVGSAACTLDPLDRTGQIRASNEADAAHCPPNFVERWGRCCPSDSSPADCPQQLPRDTTGSRFAPEQCHCPAGSVEHGDICCAAGAPACTGAARIAPEGCVCPRDYELRFGRCCPTTAGPECPAGEIGSPCDVNEDCHLPIGAAAGLAPFCLRAADMTGAGYSFRAIHGYCTALGCNDAPMTGQPVTCGPGAVCIPLLGGAARACVRACPAGAMLGASCPLSNDQLVCARANVPYSAPFTACLGDCTRGGVECPAEYACDPMRRFCVPRCSGALADTQCMTAGYARCNRTSSLCD